MIFFLSGTGNSLYAARRIAGHNHEEQVSISAAIHSEKGGCEYYLGDGESIGFVFPVYAWGPPKMVLDFIEKLKLHNYRSNYAFAVATCGGSIGNTMKVLGAALKKRGMTLHSGFSVTMPNNYIVAMDVDSEEDAQKKLAAAEGILDSINRVVERRASGEFNVVKGKPAWLLTGVIYPLFVRRGINAARFRATDDCIGCGICEKICNCNNIQMKSGKPQWGTRCIQCLGCVHYCPARAAQYGNSTAKKGRYTNPNITIADHLESRVIAK